MAKKKKAKKTLNKNSKTRMFNVTTTPAVERILTNVKRNTRASWGSILCHAICFCEKNGGFKELELYVPKSVIRAKELLEKWESKLES